MATVARAGLRTALRSINRTTATTPRTATFIPRPSTSAPTYTSSRISNLTQRRFASQYRYQRFGEAPPNPNSGPKQQQKWSNFGPAYRVQYFWRNYRPIIIVTGAGGGVVYVYNLEEVPVTKRRRFNIISAENEKMIMANGYEQVLAEFRGKVLPADHPYTQLVAKVVERLLPTTGGLAGDDWKVHVIDEPGEKNAFVMPGGKVFVFTGLLPICQTEDGLAAVLGHEIAHNVAHHAAERLSRSSIVAIAALGTALLFDVSGQSSQAVANLILSLPNSRTQEAEADHIGLLMMAQACYDPEAAVGLWQRMAAAEKGAPPQFLSTHPSSSSRIETIRGWLPEAKAKSQEAGCSNMAGYSRQFKQAFGQGLPSPEEIGQQIQQPGRQIGGGRRQQQKKDDDDFW